MGWGGAGWGGGGGMQQVCLNVVLIESVTCRVRLSFDDEFRFNVVAFRSV